MDHPVGGTAGNGPAGGGGRVGTTPAFADAPGCAGPDAAALEPPPSPLLQAKLLDTSPPASPAGVSRTNTWNTSRSGDDTAASGPIERKRSQPGSLRQTPEVANMDLMERQVRHRLRRAVGSVAGLVIDEVGFAEPEAEDAFVVPQLAPGSGGDRKSRSTSQAPGPRGRTSSVAPRGGARGRSVSIAARNGSGGSLFRDGGSDRGFGATAAAGAAVNALGAVAEHNGAEDPADEEGGEDSRIHKPEVYQRFSRVSAATTGSRPQRRSTVGLSGNKEAPLNHPTRRSTTGIAHGAGGAV